MNNRVSIIIHILIITICLHSTVVAELPFRLWRGHPDRVLAVAFSPDGNILASAGAGENIIRLWDIQSGTQISVLEGHDGVVTSVAFNKNGILASASEDETIKLWNVNSGKELRRLLGHSGQISSIAFSPDGKLLASGANDQLVKIWDTETGMELATFEGHSDAIFSVAFSPNGKLIASGSADGTIRLWDVATKQELSVCRGHEYYVWSIAFSPDGSKLVSGSGDKTVRIWDISDIRKNTTGKILATFDAYVLSVNFSPDGKLIAVGILDPGYGNTVSIWDAKTGSQIRTFDTKSKYDVAFSPDGTKLAAVGSPDGEIKLWESKTEAPKLLSLENDIIVNDQMVILKWSNITGAVYYEVEVAQDSDFTNIELPPTILADKQFPLGVWPEGSHWWRVRTGGFGQVGSWSKPSYFKVVEPPKQCVVKIDPAVQYINQNSSEESSVNIKIENVKELAGFQLDLAFDPNILEILSLRKVGEIFGEDRLILDPYPMPPPGLSILGEDGATLTPSIDNVNGLISNVIATKSKGGVSGSGILLEVHFKAKISGESELKLQSVVLVNSSQEKISDCQTISGSIIVVNPSQPWDVNKDGEVNVSDLVAVLQHLGERITEVVAQNPDVNGDGIVDDADVSLVKSHFGEKYDEVKIASFPPSPPSSTALLTPPPPPGAPKLETRFLEENKFLTTLASFDLPLLREIYEFVNQNVDINPELIPLKETLYFLIQSASQKFPPQNRLAQNYPNPFNPETWIPYQLAQEAYVAITIFDASGRVVRTIDVGYRPAGSYVSKDRAVYWDGKNSLGETVVSGVYFYSIRAGNFKAVKKMVVVR